MRYSLLAASIGLCFSGQLFAATYQLTELPSHNGSKNTFVSDANDSGVVAGRATELFNLKIDVSYIDFSDETLIREYDRLKEARDRIDDPIKFTLDDIQNNNATATDPDAHAFMRGYLGQRNGNAEFQKLNASTSLIYATSSADEKVIFDAQRDYTGGELSRSVVSFITAVSSDGAMVGWGTAPYTKKNEFTKKDENETTVFFEREFSSKGVFITPGGEVIELPSPSFDADYGGQSIATDVQKLDDGTYLVIGQSAVSVAKDGQDRFDDMCKNESEPVNVCVWRLQNLSEYYNREAYQWKLDANFNIIPGESKSIGVGLVREDDEERAHIGTALAVNNAGVAVGHSQTRKDDNFIIRQRAGFFKDGTFTQIVDHVEGYESSHGVEINNQGVAIGYRFNEFTLGRKEQVKGFYFDVNDKKYTEIKSFYDGSALFPEDINDAGYIVGQAEAENLGDNPRREAFLYNTSNSELQNINDLLPCKSDAFPYSVVEAVKITEDNRIYGVATKTAKRRDSLGQVMKDSSGADEYESIAVPVLLTPDSSGQPEQCAPEEAETYERSSASFGVFSLLALPLLMLRRRRK
ncbi:DUF3466 family protein [Pseudoalteromonas obscura]|uniref:DUF3466 family protein n=1 Tax=Pseudoalteromonas obscura TaxID=3048491 RepID=A0ABT7EEM3_9GAMM|nr:DUF3466 family protein [Pseudoalteromonas sp. P94(2023)]MDK2593720.1 DUF3466 family protein [Pseudoalteromonas sp. P94(2023)]